MISQELYQELQEILQRLQAEIPPTDYISGELADIPHRLGGILSKLQVEPTLEELRDEVEDDSYGVWFGAIKDGYPAATYRFENSLHPDGVFRTELNKLADWVLTNPYWLKSNRGRMPLGSLSDDDLTGHRLISLGYDLF